MSTATVARTFDGGNDSIAGFKLTTEFWIGQNQTETLPIFITSGALTSPLLFAFIDLAF